MPEWVFTDLQERLNAAQQLLDKRNTAYGQGHLAGTWPRARPRSPARKGESKCVCLPYVLKLCAAYY